MKNKSYGWMILKIALFGLFSIVGNMAGLMVGPSFFRLAIIAFVWAAEIVLIHWVVEIFHRRYIQKHPVDESTYRGLLTVPVRRILGILSVLPLPVFLLLFALMPEQELWLLPVGVMAGAVSMVTGGLSISRKKPYLGWIGFAMALVLYFLVLMGFLTSL